MRIWKAVLIRISPNHTEQTQLKLGKDLCIVLVYLLLEKAAKQILTYFILLSLNRTTEKTIADSLPIENLSENAGPREIVRVSVNGSLSNMVIVFNNWFKKYC